MPPKTKIAVIGTINYDTIKLPDGSTSHGYGGILFNLYPLSQICHHCLSDKVEIWPVIKVGSDRADEISKSLRELPNVCLDSIKVVERPNNHCFLTYHDDSRKSEILRGWVGAVDKSQLQRILDSDWILLNFISGGDISMKNLAWLRREANATIYTDFHSRSLGRHEDGSRFLRKPQDWRAVLEHSDYVQMNEVEFKLLSGMSAEGINLIKFARSLPKSKLQALIVTLGSRGFVNVFRESRHNKSWKTRGRVPTTTRPVVDPTGCGDIFSATFVAAMLKSGQNWLPEEIAMKVATGRVSSRKSLKNIDFARLFEGAVTS